MGRTGVSNGLVRVLVRGPSTGTRARIRYATCWPRPSDGHPGTWIPDCATWAWSDLHLHHRNIMRYTNRPFARCEQMDGAAHGAWRQVVGDAAVICGGDVALAGSLNAQRLESRSDLPWGHKLLVLGNHDFTRRGKVAQRMGAVGGSQCSLSARSTVPCPHPSSCAISRMRLPRPCSSRAFALRARRASGEARWRRRRRPALSR